MSKTILVAGYGSGISDAVARRFGREGYAVALVGRTAERLAQGAASLEKEGIRAKAFVCDLSDVAAVPKLVTDVTDALGSVAVLHWNALVGAAGDLLVAPLSELRGSLDLGIVSLVAAVQSALPELKKNKGAVLVTGGGLAYYDAHVEKMAVDWNVQGLALVKAAQHKLVGVLHHKLASEGVYVGEVTVRAVVKGSAFDRGQGTLAGSDVADAFWKLAGERNEVRVGIG